MTPGDMLDGTAREVLRAHFQPSPTALLVPLANAGGFSGARLWRLESEKGDWCLRAWPPDGPSGERLTSIHSLMALARSAGLPFVPAVATTFDGRTWLESNEVRWELCQWMLGQADFRTVPNRARLTAACVALGRIHKVWRPGTSTTGRCPAVQRRLAASDEWLCRVRSGWRPRLAAVDPATPWIERAWPILARLIPTIPKRLDSWADRPLPLQACLCDVWHITYCIRATRLQG
jgi:hypothetical protein